MSSLVFRAFRQQPWLSKFLSVLVGSGLCAVTAVPAFGAERIAFVYGGFQLSLSVSSLETYVKEGKITDEFAFYARRANPQQLAQLRAFLQQRVEVSPTSVAQITYSPLGETWLQRLGAVIQTSSGQNGFYALRSALILAADDPGGLTVLNVLHRFPTARMRVALMPVFKFAQSFSQTRQEQDAAIATVRQASAAELTESPAIDFSQAPDLRQPGAYHWQQRTLKIEVRSRNRTFPVDLYLPEPDGTSDQPSPAPIVVILHGAAEDRTTFAYLAQHLVSYGFAIAVPEDPGSNSQRFRQFLSGLATPPDATELINQPLDVKDLLDELQRRTQTEPALQNRLDLEQVGVVGHSQGGYAALSLAGAKINLEQLHRDCQQQSLDVGLLVQCQILELPSTSIAKDLQDKRVKAVLAVSPVTSTILGQDGLSKIQVPVMVVAGSADVVTPVVSEQLRPFTWLTTPKRYLVLIENGTHFSLLGGETPQVWGVQLSTELVGAEPTIARSYLNALSVAFFLTHIAKQADYQTFLSAAYAKYLSQAPLDLSLVRSTQRW